MSQIPQSPTFSKIYCVEGNLMFCVEYFMDSKVNLTEKQMERLERISLLMVSFQHFNLTYKGTKKDDGFAFHVTMNQPKEWVVRQLFDFYRENQILEPIGKYQVIVNLG